MEQPEKKLNIALFTDVFLPYIDGVVNVVDNYAKHLSKKHNVFIICPKPAEKNYAYNKPYTVINCKSVKIPIIRIHYARPNKDKAFLKKLDELNFDIIHFHSPFAMGKLAVKTAKKKSVPVIGTLHTQYKKDFKRFFKFNFIANALVKMIMKNFIGIDEAWSFNKACADTLYEYGYKGKCTLIPNGTDMIPIENVDKQVELINQEYNLLNTGNVFIFVGRLYKAKNNSFSIKALSILKQKGFNDFKFIIVGEGEDKRRLKRLTKKYGLEDNIIFTGLIKDREKLAGLLARSDLFLFPSLYDMSSLVQIEAACYKTPALLIENSNTASSVTNEVNGYTAPHHVKKYAETIGEIINNKEKLKQTGNNAYRDLYITWEQISVKVLNRYKETIKNVSKEN